MSPSSVHVALPVKGIREKKRDGRIQHYLPLEMPMPLEIP